MKFEVVAVGELKPDFLSRHIERYQTKACGLLVNYSHLAIVIDGRRVFDATGRGVGECTFEELTSYGKAVIRKSFEVKIKRECCAITWLERAKGVSYSNLQYLGFLWPWLRWVPGVRNGRRETVCSEFVADFINDCCEMKGCSLPDADFKLPCDVVDFIEYTRSLP